MADVFAVGVFIAYLGSKASNMLDATLEIGFYYFTGYLHRFLYCLYRLNLN